MIRAAPPPLQFNFFVHFFNEASHVNKHGAGDILSWMIQEQFDVSVVSMFDKLD